MDSEHVVVTVSPEDVVRIAGVELTAQQYARFKDLLRRQFEYGFAEKVKEAVDIVLIHDHFSVVC